MTPKTTIDNDEQNHVLHDFLGVLYDPIGAILGHPTKQDASTSKSLLPKQAHHAIPSQQVEVLGIYLDFNRVEAIQNQTLSSSNTKKPKWEIQDPTQNKTSGESCSFINAVSEIICDGVEGIW